MRILQDFAAEQQRAPALVILLPGAMQQPEDFIHAGFVEAVRRRKLSLDLLLIDFQLEFIGETADGSALRQLHDDVVLPAHQQYKEVWLAGISIGGFIAIAYADRYPDPATGLCLLAPYPGNRIVTSEIAAAGGIAEWLPESVPDDDGERRMWRWLQRHRQNPAAPQVHLGYGVDDRFATGHRLMADTFAADSVDTVAGGHDWPVWYQLWNNFLDSKIHPARQ